MEPGVGGGPGWRQKEPLVTHGGTKRRFGEVLRRFIAFGDIWERSLEIENFEFLVTLAPSFEAV